MPSILNKKIILSSNASWYLWNFRRNLIRKFSEQDYTIITTSSRDAYTERLEKEVGHIEMKSMSRSGTNPFKDLSLIFEYIKVYRRERPSLVFNFTIKPNIYSSIACNILNIPCISTVTGLGYSFLKKGWLRAVTISLYKISLLKNKYTVFQNSDDLNLFVSLGIIKKEKAILIEGSGVDTNRFTINDAKKTKEGELVFLLPARLLYDKGISEFVQAARIIKNIFPKSRFQLLGPLDSKNPAGIGILEVQKCESEGIIEYLGQTEDVVPFLDTCDVVVLPSYREGLSKSLLEAMAMGKPIITTDIPGCRSLVTDAENGFLVPVKDVQGLANAMIRMIEIDESSRQQMGLFGRTRVLDRFDEKIIIEKYSQLLKKAD